MPQGATLVHQQSATTGSSNFTLSAVSGRQSFATAFGTGATTNVFDYFIMNESAAEWERGTGHMSDSTTLVRDTVLESTNAGAAVNFSTGTKDICNDMPADRQKTDIHGADIASAATTNLDTATGDLVDVTGTTTITAITLSEGICRTVRFTGALTLTNGASLVLPSGANITTAAGDFAIFRGYASSVVRCVGYFPATGKAVIPFAQSKIITFTRDVSAASGNVAYTGVGFTPTTIHFISADSAYLATSFVDSAKTYYGQENINGAVFSAFSTFAVGLSGAGANPATTGQTGTINSFDSDGFTIAWTKNGVAGSATKTVAALCFR